LVPQGAATPVVSAALDEDAEASDPAARIGIHSLSVPLLEAERNLIVIPFHASAHG